MRSRKQRPTTQLLDLSPALLEAIATRLGQGGWLARFAQTCRATRTVADRRKISAPLVASLAPRFAQGFPCCATLVLHLDSPQVTLEQLTSCLAQLPDASWPQLRRLEVELDYYHLRYLGNITDPSLGNPRAALPALLTQLARLAPRLAAVVTGPRFLADCEGETSTHGLCGDVGATLRALRPLARTLEEIHISGTCSGGGGRPTGGEAEGGASGVRVSDDDGAPGEPQQLLYRALDAAGRAASRELRGFASLRRAACSGDAAPVFAATLPWLVALSSLDMDDRGGAMGVVLHGARLRQLALRSGRHPKVALEAVEGCQGQLARLTSFTLGSSGNGDDLKPYSRHKGVLCQVPRLKKLRLHGVVHLSRKEGTSSGEEDEVDERCISGSDSNSSSSSSSSSSGRDSESSNGADSGGGSELGDDDQELGPGPGAVGDGRLLQLRELEVRGRLLGERRSLFALAPRLEHLTLVDSTGLRAAYGHPKLRSLVVDFGLEASAFASPSCMRRMPAVTDVKIYMGYVIGDKDLMPEAAGDDEIAFCDEAEVQRRYDSLEAWAHGAACVARLTVGGGRGPRGGGRVVEAGRVLGALARGGGAGLARLSLDSCVVVRPEDASLMLQDLSRFPALKSLRITFGRTRLERAAVAVDNALLSELVAPLARVRGPALRKVVLRVPSWVHSRGITLGKCAKLMKKNPGLRIELV